MSEVEVTEMAPWEADILEVAEVLRTANNKLAVNAFTRIITGFLELRAGFLNKEFGLNDESYVIYEEDDLT